MALWEYKVITSGKGGFATPALLESYLNQLGTDEWEIIEFRAQPDNALAFSGLARRPTQREWTLEAAAAAAARAEADKLRAEFAAKFQAATSGPVAEGSGETSTESGTPVQDDAFRRPRDTEHDQDPYALDDSSTEEGADEWPEEDQLPSFFEAIRPHMRRNQKGPGHSVGVEYLVKKFDVLEEDLMTALKECGFEIPEDEDDKPVYVEYDGDIYWVNTNRRGELWINTREKPRPVFKIVKGTRHESPEQPEAHSSRREEHGRGRRGDSEQKKAPSSPAQTSSESVQTSESAESGQDESPARQTQSPETSVEAVKAPPTAGESGAVAPLPEGTALVDKLRPLMRRSRGGWSGTIGYLSRALRHTDAELLEALAKLGMFPSSGNEKAPIVEVGGFAYWLNRDGRGGVWINVRDAKRMRGQDRGDGEKGQEGEGVPAQQGGAPEGAEAPSSPIPSPAAEPTESSVSAAPDESPSPAAADVPVATEAVPSPAVEARSEPSSAASPLSGVRLLLKPTRTGAFAGEIGYLSSKLGKSVEELVAVLLETGLHLPEKAREKPVFVEQAAEIFWLNLNSKGELCLNAKASKYAAEAKESGGSQSESSPPESSEKKARRGPRQRRRSSDSAS